MKNSIRCCISCILPCGALDVIRIVHADGRVEEIRGTIRAAEIMEAHPKHVLKKPSSPSKQETYPKIVILPPDAELQRGKIYFLMPAPQSSVRRKKKEHHTRSTTNNNISASGGHHGGEKLSTKNDAAVCLTNLVNSDQYLSEILSEKVSTQRDRRRGRVGVWRPHLESISEIPNLDL